MAKNVIPVLLICGLVIFSREDVMLVINEAQDVAKVSPLSSLPGLPPTEKVDTVVLSAQGLTDYPVEAYASTDPKNGRLLVIPTPKGTIYVSESQSRAFFGL